MFLEFSILFTSQITGLTFQITGFTFQITCLTFQIIEFTFQIAGLTFQITGLTFQITGITFQITVPPFRMIGDRTFFRIFSQKNGKIENSKNLVGLRNVPRYTLLQSKCPFKTSKEVSQF